MTRIATVVLALTLFASMASAEMVCSFERVEHVNPAATNFSSGTLRLAKDNAFLAFSTGDLTVYDCSKDPLECDLPGPVSGKIDLKWDGYMIEATSSSGTSAFHPIRTTLYRLSGCTGMR